MVIDSSALIAVMTGEPERRAFIEAITAADTRLVAAPTMLETSMMVLSRTGESRLSHLRDFCVRGAVETVPFGAEHVDLALDAFRRFGKGRHPAGLNFGDCFSYALAKANGEPLLLRAMALPRTISGESCNHGLGDCAGPKSSGCSRGSLAGGECVHGGAACAAGGGAASLHFPFSVAILRTGSPR